MQNSDARIVRGLSIAVIILATLSAIGFLLGAISVAAAGAFASDPTLYGNGIALDGYSHGYYDRLSAEDTASIVGFSLVLATVFLVWELLCSIVTLIAGIIGLRNHSVTEKLGGVFGWSIAGAIAALLSGRIITMILFIIMAIYTNKLRNPAQPLYGQPGAYGAPQPYAAQPGYYPQPQQPYQESYPQQQVPPAPQPQPPTTPEQK